MAILGYLRSARELEGPDGCNNISLMTVHITKASNEHSHESSGLS